MKSSIEYDITLQSRVEQTSQAEVARDLGMTTGAVWQMLKCERDIFLRKINGQWFYSEIAPWRQGPKLRKKPLTESTLNEIMRIVRKMRRSADA